MRAISIRAPWTWAILHAGKRLENRKWPGLDLMKLPGALVLHTSARAEFDDWPKVEWACGRRPPPVGAHYTGHIVGLATVKGAITDIDQAEKLGQGEWWAGPGAILLEEVLPLPRPIPAHGSLGLWAVEQPDAERVIEQLLELQQIGWAAALAEEGDYVGANVGGNPPPDAEPDPHASCYRKRRYSTPTWADKAKRRAESDRPVRLRVYPCEHCQGYHLTSMVEAPTP